MPNPQELYNCDKYPTTYQHRFNQLPSPLRSLTEAQFAQSRFFTYEPQFVEYRQPHYRLSELPPDVAVRLGFNVHKDYPDAITSCSMRMYWFDAHSGIAAVNDYWSGKVYWFEFGCDHDWRHTATLGRCYNRYVCDRCGVTKEIDSSD